jgi:hypothetical protein
MPPQRRLDLAHGAYEAIDERRTRVVGAVWQDAKEIWVKIEGARPVNHPSSESGNRALDGGA